MGFLVEITDFTDFTGKGLFKSSSVAVDVHIWADESSKSGSAVRSKLPLRSRLGSVNGLL